MSHRNTNFIHFGFKEQRVELWRRAFHLQQQCGAGKYTAYIKAIESEKRHSVKRKRCKNHDDVWSVIVRVSVEWRSLVFPTFDGRRGWVASRVLACDFSGPTAGTVFYEVKSLHKKLRLPINYALTHSDSTITCTIGAYCFFRLFFMAITMGIIVINIGFKYLNGRVNINIGKVAEHLLDYL